MSALDREWLVITLVAPMASFGEAPGNARRGSATRPTKSALLGLLGAALGLRRHDVEAQTALASGYRVATRTRCAGSPLRDFHTYQSLPFSSRGTPPQTRAEALSRRGKRETSITVREYRCDVAYDAAFGANVDARWPLETLREALLRPAFTLYLGRKSCPLAWPLDPSIEGGETVEDAFDERDVRLTAIERRLKAPLPRSLRKLDDHIAVEDGEPLRESSASHRREARRDQPSDRVRWHFRDRVERVVSYPSRKLRQ